MKKLFLYIVVLFVVIQVIPYGREHVNPEVLAEPEWDKPLTRELFMQSCADCHSNETVWPWYSNVAPVSWLLSYDVTEGREHFNISEWGYVENDDADEAAEELEDGDMPPSQYLFTHRDAILSATEKKQLIEGLKATFGKKQQEH